MPLKSKQVIIPSYDKFSQDYINSVIKFKIDFNGKYIVYRRYSEF